MNLANKRVLVTGADGFIGSHLVEELVGAGCQVRALVYYNSFNSWGWLDTLEKGILDQVEVLSGDIRDRGSVSRAMAGIEVVFHLAALIGIPYSYYSPESYVGTNITGTLNVLEEAKRFEPERILVTSTSEVYGTARYVPIDENHPFQGQSPYSATKIGADRIAESYHRSFGLPVTIVRPFNTYGPRQSARAVIPTIIGQLMAGLREISLGSLSPTRDLVFVKDTARGFRSIAECDDAVGEEINIATEVEVSIGDLAATLIEKIAPGAEICSDNDRIRPAASEVERLLGSRQKITRLTAWAPKWSLDEGLEETIAWFRKPENLRGYKTHIYNV